MERCPRNPQLPPPTPASGGSPKARRRLGAAGFGAALGAAAALSVLAGGFTPLGTQPPLSNNILPPGDCAGCHGDFNGSLNVEPWPTWAGSMMANAARDPIFWAALDVANDDVPGVGDFCLRCHVPTGWLAGRSELPAGSPDGCGLLGNIDESDNDFAGVSCHLCHRMYVNPSPPSGEDPVYYENAQYWVDDASCPQGGTGPCRRGPYDYSMGGSPPPGNHPYAFSQYHKDADICGNCHNVTSPAETLIDENGNDTGVPFPVERTFKEWQQSDFAGAGPGFTACQGCHMPDATADPVYACLQEQNNRTGDLPIHQFAGGNTWVPAVLRDEYPALGRSDELDATIAWALDMLQNRSATVEVATPTFAPVTGELEVAVRVTNLSGHKLPTGYTEGRRMWLNLVARDDNGATVFESGAYDLATGVLTEDAQAKVYRSDRGIWDLHSTGQCDTADAMGDPIFHFVLENCITLDNRIPPLGFTGGSDLETQPVGYTYPETSPGSGILVNYDNTTYQLTVPPGTPGPLTVEATLYYQTTSKEYVEFLRDQAVTGSFPDDCIPRSGSGAPNLSRGEILHDFWVNNDRSPPVAMGADNAAVELPVFADGFESGTLAAWSAAIP